MQETPVKRFCAVFFKFHVAGLCWLILCFEEVAVVFQVKTVTLKYFAKESVYTEFGFEFHLV